MIKLRYEDGCKPQVLEQGNKYLLFCKQDFYLPKRTEAYVDTWVEANWWIFRIDKWPMSLAKYWFMANKTVFNCDKWKYEKVLIKIQWMANKDILIKAWTVLCEIEWINTTFII